MNHYTPKQRYVIKEYLNKAKNITDKRFTFWTREDTLKLESRNTLEDNDVLNLKHYYFWVERKRIRFKDLRSIDNPTHTLKERVVIDLETTGTNYFKDEIKVLGISDGHIHAYINLDEIVYDNCRWHNIEGKSGINYVRGLEKAYRLLNMLKDYNYNCVAYNVQFENAFLIHHFGIQLNWTDDPQIMAYILLNKPYPKLSELSSEYLQRYPKSLEEISGNKFDPSIYDDWSLRDSIALYCCEDCYETWLLCDILEEKLCQEKLHNVYSIDFKSALVASQMRLQGIKIDTSLLAKLKPKIEDYIEILLDEIEMECDYRPNLKSSAQLNKLFFEVLELDSTELKRTQNGYSLDAKNRQLLISQHPIALKIDNCIKALDVINKYVNPFPKYIYFGKIHTQFQTIVTTTGRLSSTNPNLQNIPNPAKYASYGNDFLAEIGQNIRDLFIPSEGNILIACDYSSFELRILAHFSQEPTLIECFTTGKSLHDVMTEKLFDITYDKTNPDHVAKRTVTKTINFGLCYGMTYRRLYEECKLRGLSFNAQYCKDIIQEYWNMLPHLSEWFASLKIKAIQQGYTETILGRRRYYSFSTDVIKYCKSITPSLDSFENLLNERILTHSDNEQLRQAGNAPIQGSNADVIRIAMNKCRDIPSVILLLNIHDELVFECNEHLKSYACDEVKKRMESAIVLNVPVIAEPKAEYSWGKAK